MSILLFIMEKYIFDVVSDGSSMFETSLRQQDQSWISSLSRDLIQQTNHESVLVISDSQQTNHESDLVISFSRPTMSQI